MKQPGDFHVASDPKTIFRRVLHSPALIGLFVALFAFIIYLRTLAPTVGFIDSGELSTVACTLGIAHPTGYPLFTLLGWLFSRLPIAGEQIVRLNMMAALFSAAGVFVFFQLVHLILSLVFARDDRGKAGGADLLLASAGSSLLLAFSETYWAQAVSIEVYSLHVLFLSLTTLVFVKACSFRLTGRQENGSAFGREGVWWLLFAFLLGLSFTNHMTTILLAPGMLYLYFALHGFQSSSWKKIGTMAPFFLAGLSLYLYLPVRAAQNPLFAWGDPETLERFLWHLSGKQYRVWIFSSTDAAGRQFKYFLSSLPTEFAYVGLIPALIGIGVLFSKHRKLLVTTALLFVTCVFYSINYDIHDIDSYFLLAFMMIPLWAGIGLIVIVGWPGLKHSWTRVIAGPCILLFAAVPLWYHWNGSDESSNFLVEDYTTNMFASVEPNALVISYQWDYWVSASYYYQYVKGVRPDVTVVDKELLRRSWYIKELEHRHPDLITASRTEVDAFLREVWRFEHDLPYNYAVVQSAYREMIHSFIAKSIEHRPVYVTAEIEVEFTAGFQRIPHGVAFKLVTDNSFHPTQRIPFVYRPFDRHGRSEDTIRKLYSDAMVARGVYYASQGGDHQETKECLKMALQFDPTSPNAKHWFQTLVK